MVNLIRLPVLLAVGVALTGCNTGGRQGVFEPTAIAPPPSLSGSAPAQSAAVTPTTRRNVAVSERPIEAAPEREPAVQPVLTGRGLGAGIRF